MHTPKIAVYTMAKNEAKNVERYAKNTEDADVVVVTDTGSTDGTPDLLREHGVIVHDARIVPWRFDIATNCAMCNVPDDIDICVKLDLDEVIFTDGSIHWRDAITEAWQENAGQMRYWYTWSWHVLGETPAVRFKTANVHSRKGFMWMHPGHAALTNTEPHRPLVSSEQFEIHHYMENKGRPNYLSLLEQAVNENRCQRTLFYLGREYSFRQMYQDAINTLNDYLDMAAAAKYSWKAEQANAMRIIGTCFEKLGQASQALAWFIRAEATYPDTRDLWYELLRFFHSQGDFHGGYWAAHRCLAITRRDDQWVGHTEAAWFDAPFILAAKCAWHTDKRDEAKLLLKKALDVNPNSEEGRRFAITVGLIPQ